MRRFSSSHDRETLVPMDVVESGAAASADVPAAQHAESKWKILLAFWLFGMNNNFPFVVMLSAAHDILKRNDPTLGTGVVLLADILPDLFVKLTLPFLMQRWSFSLRVTLVVTFSVLSFVTVAFANNTVVSLLGVAAGSFSTGLGEITFLGLTAHYDKVTIAAWSSGTGMAGFGGSLTYLGFTLFMSPSSALLCMLFSPFILALSYAFLLHTPPSAISVPASAGAVNKEGSAESRVDDCGQNAQHHEEKELLSSDSTPKPKISFREQVKALLVLWPFTLPLLVGYFCAYVINQGVYENVYWVNEFISEDAQYRVFQTLYRLGVLISRSTSTWLPIRRVWIPAALESFNLIFMALDCRFKLLPSLWMWFILTFYEGLLAGATYVNSFTQISQNAKAEEREFVMGGATVAGSIGIASAGGVAVGVNSALRSVGGR